MFVKHVPTIYRAIDYIIIVGIWHGMMNQRKHFVDVLLYDILL